MQPMVDSGPDFDDTMNMQVIMGGGCPPGAPWAVLNGDGEVVACRVSQSEALAHMQSMMGGGRSAQDGTGIQYRSFAPELEVRSGGNTDGRTIYGIAVPYNAPTRINDNLVEQFSRGAFNHQLRAPQRVKFAREHMALGGTLIGAATLLRDDAAGLYGEWRVSRTPAGDETLELVRDGALDHLSIAFRERENQRLAGGVVNRRKADLNEVAVVLQGAYGDLAAAAGVRSRQTPVAAQEMDVRAAYEEFRHRPELKDYDLEIRAIRLGMPF
jgi:hypothetical protein